MGQDELATVTLTRADWAIVQEALDNYFYEVEHSPAGGIRRTTKQRLAERRDALLESLPRLDIAIADQAGVGPLFGR